MSLDLNELFDAKIQAEYWLNLDPEYKVAYLGGNLFPVQKVPGLELSWIKGYKDYSIALQPAAYDAQAPYRDRRGLAKMLTEMPFFRERMRLGEKEKAQLRTFSANGLELAKSIIAKIYDDHMQLINGAHVIIEVMRMSLLDTAKIKVISGDETGQGIVYEYNFDPKGIWKKLNHKTLASSQVWTIANKGASNPLKDVLDFIIYLKKSRSVEPAKMLMNFQTFLDMITSESIVKAMNPLAATNMFITPTKAQQFIQDQLGIQLIIYDKNYKDTNKVVQKFIPDGEVIFLPNGPVGKTNYGITPEEGDLLAGGNTDAKVAIVDTGIAITTMKIKHPVNVETIVSCVALPSFERMDDVAVLHVHG